MRSSTNRRQFIERVGSGMLVAGVGATAATELGNRQVLADTERDDRLDFGNLKPLVQKMQELDPDRLQANLIGHLKSGEVELRQLVAAAALANAEAFGGEDYVGYHTEMALIPALEMSSELKDMSRALPILKVIYRNAEQIQNVGGAKHRRLRKLKKLAEKSSGVDGLQLREAVRSRDMDGAERLFGTLEQASLDERFNALLPTIEDDINVHRFVLAHRAMELVDVVGGENAQVMLRQCVRHCVDVEQHMHQKGRKPSPIRQLLPKLVQDYQLETKATGTTDPGPEWIEKMSRTIYFEKEASVAEAIAAALAEGIAPSVVSEAISLAANSLVLRQRSELWRTHGDSAGVHASDAANAWRNMIGRATPVNAAGGLICSAYHVARYDSFAHDPLPTEVDRMKVKQTDAKKLLGVLDEAIRGNDQLAAAAAAQVYGDLGHPAQPIFRLLLKYSISEDGRLHAEKFYRTACEEYDAMRPQFKWRQIVGLARVSASAYGYDRFDNQGHRAGGYEEACRMLGASA